MPLRYLFGPVSSAFADQNLRRARESGACRTFGPAGADVAVGPSDGWDAVLARLPCDWRPDFVALWLPYAAVPAGLWAATIPLVGLAADWNLLWRAYRRLLPRCELVLTDAPGVAALARDGVSHARPANLFGCERAFLEEPAGDGPRDIDVLFVGNLQPAVQRGRLPWLARLARLGDRFNVQVRGGVFGADYRALLRRAKVVFNRGIRGECNRRAFEAAACGALLFQERENQEVGEYFADRRECVLYDDKDLEGLLEHYLTHEDERRVLAEAARKRVQGYAFEDLWDQAVETVEREWNGFHDQARRRAAADPEDGLLARAWQTTSGGADPSLAADLEATLAARPRSAELHNALGVARSLAGAGEGRAAAAALGRAADCFRQALACDPAHPVAGLNLVESLVGLGQTQAVVGAADAARRALALLNKGEGPGRAALGAVRFPPAFDHFRVEWERAGWENAGDPAAESRAAADLLRWRLHTLLGELTGELSHFHEAALARPDLPTSRAALGCALGRADRPGDALPHLRRAAAADPFDPEAARALHQALRDAGDAEGARRAAFDRRRLARAAPHLPQEAWFAEPPPAPDALASIIVLCCNEVEYTRLCLESVLQYTRPPYELILIDNGSSDGTPAYLEEVSKRPGPARVEVIRNKANRGFPAGCNQGLAKARGRYVVFLNNDVVVTEGWLEGLVRWALHDWPTVGMVGAVTNYASGPQQVPVDYTSLDGLESFAARRRREFGGKALEFPRLTGYCLLARRDVLDRVGGYDERFGTGFFDDDDLCVRVRQAGCRLLVALGVFVHHFGSRTFAALGVDCQKQLTENFERFKAKWGPDHAAGYRLPDAAAASAAPPSGEPAPTAVVPAPTARAAGRMRVSLCMIVKNEEKNLPVCLGSVADLVDEVVVMDTGSTDRTKEIAASFGAKVFDFPWVDDFSAARNESLKHATGDWVFWMDADDRLDEDNRARLRALFAGLKDENVVYSMKCLCLPDERTRTATEVDHPRLFRNRPEVRWEHRVHEQILPAIRRAGGDVRWSDVVIHHTGYQDPALRRKKLERDLRILHREQAERPDHPFVLFNLGQVYQELGRPAEALPLFRRSLERSSPTDSIVRKLYALLAQGHRQLRQTDRALAVLADGLRVCADDPELLFVEGLARRDAGDFVGAKAALQRLLQTTPGAHFASMDPGLRGYKGRHNLGVVCRQLGEADEAEALWRQVAAERPDFAPAWIELAELHLERQEWDGLEESARGLEQSARAPMEAAVFRARGHMARGEFPAARALLERAVAAAPQALWPRVILSHALLQEGKDLDAAERALLDVLALAPDFAEAKQNLAVLVREKAKRAADAVWMDNVPLTQLYLSACQRASDIHEHLPTLHALAKECRHVTEFGTRTGLSTTALLHAQPDKLVCYDRVKYPQVEHLRRAAGRTEFVFREEDVLWADIEETDLLFIDTLHTYGQLKEELRLHAHKARKYIVLHDTTTFGEKGEVEGQGGLWPAVEEFLAKGTFRLKARYENNNGLTVLESVPVGGA
jgi:GT2 family glycosyltransferase/predicted Zn-dependent protease